MPEIRVDPLSGHKVIVAGERSARPGGEPRCPAPQPIDVEGDPFAEGHERQTPPELYAVRPSSGAGGRVGGGIVGTRGSGIGGGMPNTPGWTVRVVPNLYPALVPDSPEYPALDPDSFQYPALDPDSLQYPALDPDSLQPQADAQPDLFCATPARGEHEVIVNAPEPVRSLAELPLERVVGAMEVWRARMRVHADSACVQLIVNERREAGASLEHTHAQLYALDFVPAEVARERERAGAYATRTMGRSLLEDLVAEEVRRGERIVAIDEEAVLMAPYGSRMPFQLMLAPRVPRMRFEDDGPLGAALLHDGLTRLARHFGTSPPLNMWVRTAPRGAEHFCWRIDVAPRLTHIAGLELSTGVHLNIVAPERAASVLREA
jgi:UDPglucose--hexose-1-phosphate uridylyltransferase